MSLNKKNTPPASQEQFPLTKKNYILLAIGAGLIALGFILMSTEGFIDATQFSLSLYVSPVLIIGGFVWIIYAILAKDKKETNPNA
jgi:hypothetical protein